MKKVLIVSDTHGQSDLMYEVIKRVKPVDLLVHCGDVGYRGIERELMMAADCPVYVVSGNNDYGNGMPQRYAQWKIASLYATTAFDPETMKKNSTDRLAPLKGGVFISRTL